MRPRVLAELRSIAKAALRARPTRLGPRVRRASGVLLTPAIVGALAGCVGEADIVDLSNLSNDEVFAVVRRRVCDFGTRCGLESFSGASPQQCLDRAGRSAAYATDISLAERASLQDCLEQLAGDDCADIAQEIGLDEDSESATNCDRAAEYLDILSGDYDDPCQRAVRKFNACRTGSGGPQLEFRGICNDEAQAGTTVIPMRSRSEAYLACTSELGRCECDGVGVPFVVS